MLRRRKPLSSQGSPVRSGGRHEKARWRDTATPWLELGGGTLPDNGNDAQDAEASCRRLCLVAAIDMVIGEFDAVGAREQSVRPTRSERMTTLSSDAVGAMEAGRIRQVNPPRSKLLDGAARQRAVPRGMQHREALRGLCA